MLWLVHYQRSFRLLLSAIGLGLARRLTLRIAAHGADVDIGVRARDPENCSICPSRVCACGDTDHWGFDGVCLKDAVAVLSPSVEVRLMNASTSKRASAI